MVVVSHARPLVRAIEAHDGESVLPELEKEFGSTVLAGQELLGRQVCH